jgi:hypothetical protein
MKGIQVAAKMSIKNLERKHLFVTKNLPYIYLSVFIKVVQFFEQSQVYYLFVVISPLFYCNIYYISFFIIIFDQKISSFNMIQESYYLIFRPYLHIHIYHLLFKHSILAHIFYFFYFFSSDKTGVVSKHFLLLISFVKYKTHW